MGFLLFKFPNRLLADKEVKLGFPQTIKDWKNTQFERLAELIGERVNNSTIWSKEEKSAIGNTISVATIQRMLEGNYIEDDIITDKRKLGSIHKLSHFVGYKTWFNFKEYIVSLTKQQNSNDNNIDYQCTLFSDYNTLIKRIWSKLIYIENFAQSGIGAEIMTGIFEPQKWHFLLNTYRLVRENAILLPEHIYHTIIALLDLFISNINELSAFLRKVIEVQNNADFDYNYYNSAINKKVDEIYKTYRKGFESLRIILRSEPIQF